MTPPKEGTAHDALYHPTSALAHTCAACCFGRHLYSHAHGSRRPVGPRHRGQAPAQACDRSLEQAVQPRQADTRAVFPLYLGSRARRPRPFLHTARQECRRVDYRSNPIQRSARLAGAFPCAPNRHTPGCDCRVTPEYLDRLCCPVPFYDWKCRAFLCAGDLFNYFLRGSSKSLPRGGKRLGRLESLGTADCCSIGWPCRVYCPAYALLDP